MYKIRRTLSVKFRDLFFSRRTYAIAYIFCIYIWRESIGVTDQQAAEMIATVMTWIISDSIKPTGGMNINGTHPGLDELKGSMRFWILVATQLGVTLLGDDSGVVAAAGSTAILGRSLRKPGIP